MKPSASKAHLTIGEMVLFGMLAALTFALQVVMSPLPNIEPVSLLVMLFAVTFGWKSLYPVYIFATMEIFYYGINIWNIYYLYVWTILAVAAILLRNMEQPVLWALLSGIFGLFFGALCAIADVFMGGFEYAVVKWANGILFDITHCVANFIIALLLFVPLRKLLLRLYSQVRR
jgi:energy-coupling factor transport system substrate-specific component